MNRGDVVIGLLDDVRALVPDSISVRTQGGDQDTDPPEIILDYRENRMPYENGNTPFAGAVTDDNGNKVAKEYHTYWSVDADFQLRYYSERQRDAMVDIVQAAFVPYEADASKFDSDTREWQVASSGPRENTIVEPDWYEAGVLVQFEYIKRIEEDADTIEDIIVRDIDVIKD